MQIASFRLSHEKYMYALEACQNDWEGWGGGSIEV